MKRYAVGAATLAVAGIAGLTTACQPVDPESCRGTLGAVRVETVSVPAGASCTLEGTRVDGDVKIGRNATTVIRGAIIGGNVQAEGHKEVRLGRSARVNGDIQTKQGGVTSVDSTTVGGNIQVESNRGRQNINKNRVIGDIQLFSNLGGPNIVSNNRVDGNLQCKSNSPAPTGGNNVVHGNKQDQCARL